MAAEKKVCAGFDINNKSNTTSTFVEKFLDEKKYPIPFELFRRFPNIPISDTERKENISRKDNNRFKQFYKTFESLVTHYGRIARVQQMTGATTFYAVYIEGGPKGYKNIDYLVADKTKRYDLGITCSKQKARAMILEILFFYFTIVYGVDGEEMREWTSLDQKLYQYIGLFLKEDTDPNWHQLISLFNIWCCNKFPSKIQFKISDSIKLH